MTMYCSAAAALTLSRLSSDLCERVCLHWAFAGLCARAPQQEVALIHTTTCVHHCTGPAALGAAPEARGAAGAYPGALPPDPWDDDSSSGTAGSPRGSESGFQGGLRAPRPPAAPHAPAGLAAGLVPGQAAHAPAAADAGASAAAAAAPAAPPAPVPLTQGGLDALARVLHAFWMHPHARPCLFLWHCLLR